MRGKKWKVNQRCRAIPGEKSSGGSIDPLGCIKPQHPRIPRQSKLPVPQKLTDRKPEVSHGPLLHSVRVGVVELLHQHVVAAADDEHEGAVAGVAVQFGGVDGQVTAGVKADDAEL